MKTRIRAARAAALAVAAVASLGAPRQAEAQASDMMIGQLMLFAGNFCPRSWAQANGALLAISQNQALFSVLGTTYGGDGVTTFALPDLRGRAPVHVGQGPGLSNYTLGARYGAESTTLSVAQMPSHNHMINVVAQPGDKGGPGDDYLAVVAPKPLGSSTQNYSAYHDGPPDKQMDPGMVALNGGSQPASIQAPRIAMMWCVAINGIYPSRN